MGRKETASLTSLELQELNAIQGAEIRVRNLQFDAASWWVCLLSDLAFFPAHRCIVFWNLDEENALSKSA